MLNVEWPDTPGIETQTLNLLRAIKAHQGTPIDDMADEPAMQAMTLWFAETVNQIEASKTRQELCYSLGEFSKLMFLLGRHTVTN